MLDSQQRQLLAIGGACGVASFVLYVLLITLSLSDAPSQYELSRTFLLAATFPVLGIIFSYALYTLIALERQGAANRLAFLFSVAALTIVAMMFAIQLAVRFGAKAYLSGIAQPGSFLRALRMLDMGLDVVFDVFLGWAMMVIALPMYRHTRLGAVWAVPSFVLGLLLIALNVATFPFPPATKGLFDIGPAIGVYNLLLSVRVMMVGLKKNSTTTSET